MANAIDRDPLEPTIEDAPLNPIGGQANEPSPDQVNFGHAGENQVEIEKEHELEEDE